MITIEHITKKFKKLHALDDVSAAFRKGQVVSLVGPNGSGKTTLIKQVLYPAVQKLKGEFSDKVGIHKSVTGDLDYLSQIERPVK